MRTTVGSLPSSVYWRRRAVVLGAVVLIIIVLFIAWPSHSKNDKSNNAGHGTGATSPSYPTPAPSTTTSPTAGPSFVDAPPQGSNQTLPNPADPTSTDPTAPPVQSSTGTGANTGVTAPAGSSCTDAEMSVQPIVASSTLRRATTVPISIVIKNIGSRTCTRDVGAGPQELYLDSGATTYWSSDTCSVNESSDVRTFAPGQSVTFSNSWNGHEANSCDTIHHVPNGAIPPDGTYDLHARLGTLKCTPVRVTITG